MLSAIALAATLVAAPSEAFALRGQLDAPAHRRVSLFADVRTLPHMGPGGFRLTSWVGRAEIRVRVHGRVHLAGGTTLARSLGALASPVVKLPTVSITFVF